MTSSIPKGSRLQKRTIGISSAQRSGSFPLPSSISYASLSWNGRAEAVAESEPKGQHFLLTAECCTLTILALAKVREAPIMSD